eukprot:CAMPEP_0113941930 /NCGR_PEP_ID=MMETSP1339-20121228/7754_1 /TAXON_ID=94617 /ORGANISM="Fibrocapsa japonica" /LENGTH=228 /DNA_ID=CAMNT_0000946215 /DNA_START=24 /DNA_END=710 /DNA_ORIENTATION=- /assembly_acc=CAM_ASM_000762
MVAAGDDEKVLQQRLVSKETVFLGTSISRIAARFHAFLGAVQQEGEADEDAHPAKKQRCEAAYDVTQRELQLYSLEVAKAQIVSLGAEHEIEAYKSRGKEIEEKVKKEAEKVEQLKAQLEEEKEIQRRKEEYEALAKVANALPPQAKTTAEIAKIRDQLQSLEKDSSLMSQEVDLRGKQFRTLLQSVADLQATFREDKEMEALKKGADAGAKVKKESEEDDQMKMSDA